MVDFRAHPRYQKGLQKIMALPAHYRAVLSTRALDASFGDEHQRHVMSAALHDANRQLKQDELDLRRQRLDFQVSMANRELDSAAGQAKKAKVFDVGNLALSSFMGYGQLKRDRAMSKKYDDLLEKMSRR